MRPVPIARPTVPLSPRPVVPHPQPSFMHDSIVYGSLNRQSLGYNVHVSYETKCFEVFADPTMGRIALALPHGSILVEIAKAQFQAKAVHDRARVLSAQEPSLRQSCGGQV